MNTMEKPNAVAGTEAVTEKQKKERKPKAKQVKKVDTAKILSSLRAIDDKELGRKTKKPVEKKEEKATNVTNEGATTPSSSVKNISEKDFRDFVDRNVVSKEILEYIAQKKNNGEQMTPEETAVYSHFEKEVDENVSMLEEKKVTAPSDLELVLPEPAEFTNSARTFNKDGIVAEAGDSKNVGKVSDPSIPTPVPAGAEEVAQSPKVEKELKLLTETYSKKGLGEIVKELSYLPEFAALTEGQKLLVTQSVANRLYEHVKTEGRKGFLEEHAGSGFVKRAWKNATKNAIQARYEKEALQSAAGSESKKFVSEVAPDLISVFAKAGLEADFSAKRDGKVLIKYSSLDTHEASGAPLAFDIAANAFSSIPDDWGKPGATLLEKNAYMNALKEYERARDEYVDDLLSRAIEMKIPNPEAYAVSVASQTNATVGMMRLVTSDPKMLSRLESIGKHPAWMRGIKDTVTERFIAGGGGASMAGRAGVASLFGVGSAAALAAAPITAAVIGGFLGHARAKEALRDNDRLARSGFAMNKDVSGEMRAERNRLVGGVEQTDEQMVALYKALSEEEQADVDAHMAVFYQKLTKGETAKRMSAIDRKIDQLEIALRIHDAVQTDEERAAAIMQIKTYADFIDAKLELGQVDFGEEKGRLVRQFNLMNKLHEARVEIASAGLESTVENIFAKGAEIDTFASDELRSRTRSFGYKVHSRTEKARSKQIIYSTLKGVGFGAIAGSAGAAIRYYGEQLNFGWFRHGNASSVAENTQQENSVSATDLTKKIVNKDTVATVKPTVTSTLPPAAPEKVVEAAKTLGAVKAHVEFSSKGFEQTLLVFRHSPEFKALTSDQQAAFEGSVVKLAKELKGFRPDAVDGKESISFTKGSQFNVSAEGKIFITDPSGKNTILGHIEGSKIVSDANEADLKYIDADRARRTIETVGKTPRKTVTDLGIRTKTPAEGELPESLRGSAVKLEPLNAAPRVETTDTLPESLRGSAIKLEQIKTAPATDTLDTPPESLRGSAVKLDTVRSAVTSPVQNAPRVIELTPALRTEVEFLADSQVIQEVNNYFSDYSSDPSHTFVQGIQHPAWLKTQNRATFSVMNDYYNVLPHFRGFIKDVRMLSAKYPGIRTDLPIKEFLRQAYRLEMAEKVRSGVAA